MESIPVSKLSPELSNLNTKQFRAIVTLIWPFSSATRKCALLLAEPDFRLRERGGQVRVQFTGSSARAIAKTGIGSGDEVVVGLRGGRFVEQDSAIRTPGKSIDWELQFGQTLVVQILRDGQEIASLDIVDAAPTPVAGSPVRKQLQPFATPLKEAVTPLRATPLLPTSVKRWTSPALLKRSRLSGDLFAPRRELPPADRDDEPSRKRRRRSYKDWTVWKYSPRTPSPEKEDRPEEDENMDEASDTQGSPSRAAQVHLQRPATPALPSKQKLAPYTVAAPPPNTHDGIDERELPDDLHTPVEEDAQPPVESVAEPDRSSSPAALERHIDGDHTYPSFGQLPPGDMPYFYPGETQLNTQVAHSPEGASPFLAKEDVASHIPSSPSPWQEAQVPLSRAETPESTVPDSDGDDQPAEAIMPPPRLPSLQTSFVPTAPELLTPIGQQPRSPVIKPLDSSTLPMPSPFPGGRDGYSAYFEQVHASQVAVEIPVKPAVERPVEVPLENTEEKQEALEAPSEADSLVESSFYSSVGWNSFQPNHESVYTPVRFTFGMDGTAFSRQRRVSKSPESALDSGAGKENIEEGGTAGSWPDERAGLPEEEKVEAQRASEEVGTGTLETAAKGQPKETPEPVEQEPKGRIEATAELTQKEGADSSEVESEDEQLKEQHDLSEPRPEDDQSAPEDGQPEEHHNPSEAESDSVEPQLPKLVVSSDPHEALREELTEEITEEIVEEVAEKVADEVLEEMQADFPEASRLVRQELVEVLEEEFDEQLPAELQEEIEDEAEEGSKHPERTRDRDLPDIFAQFTNDSETSDEDEDEVEAGSNDLTRDEDMRGTSVPSEQGVVMVSYDLETESEPEPEPVQHDKRIDQEQRSASPPSNSQLPGERSPSVMEERSHSVALDHEANDEARKEDHQEVVEIEEAAGKISVLDTERMATEQQSLDATTSSALMQRAKRATEIIDLGSSSASESDDESDVESDNDEETNRVDDVAESSESIAREAPHAEGPRISPPRSPKNIAHTTRFQENDTATDTLDDLAAPFPMDDDTPVFLGEDDFMDLDRPTSRDEALDRADFDLDVKVETTGQETALGLSTIPAQSVEVEIAATSQEELMIAVPETGRKMGEQYRSVAATGPARNTRSKTRTSLSPAKQESPLFPQPSRSNRSMAPPVTSRPSLEPSNARARSTMSPEIQPVLDSSYRTRSQLKLSSPTKSTFISMDQHDQEKDRRRGGFMRPRSPASQTFSQQDSTQLTVSDYPDLYQPSQELGTLPTWPNTLHRKYAHVSSIQDSEEGSVHSENSLSTVPFSDGYGGYGAPAYLDGFSDDMKQVARSRDPSAQPVVSPPQPQRARQKSQAAPSDLAQKPSVALDEIEEVENSPGDVTPSSKMGNTIALYPGSYADEGARDVIVISSSPPPSPQKVVQPEISPRFSPSKERPSSMAQQASHLNSNRPLTPDATQHTLLKSQPSFSVEQSLPLTPQLTQPASQNRATAGAIGISVNGEEEEEVPKSRIAVAVAVQTPPKPKTPSRRKLRSPSIHSEDLSDPDEEIEAQDAATLGPPSTGLSTPTSYYTPLKDLPYFLNRASTFHTSANPDILALVVSASSPSKRASTGPRHYNTMLQITDASTFPAPTTVQVFRAFSSALPIADAGDVILLRSFQAKSLNRKCTLVSCDESAWAVWRWGKPVWGVKKKLKCAEVRAREEVRGPSVEMGEGEWREVERLRGWWVREVKSHVEEGLAKEKEDVVMRTPKKASRNVNDSQSQSGSQQEVRRSPRKNKGQMGMVVGNGTGGHGGPSKL